MTRSPGKPTCSPTCSSTRPSLRPWWNSDTPTPWPGKMNFSDSSATTKLPPRSSRAKLSPMRGDQLARQWLLVQRLGRSRGGVGLAELADDLGCVRRTIYRDLDALMYAGFPVVSEKRDGKVYYRFLDSFKLGDVPFTADEILALAFGEDLLRTLEGTVFHDSIQSALTKIRSALSSELIGFLDTIAGSFRVLPEPHKRYAKSRTTIEALNEAVLGRRVLHMRYRNGQTGEESSRDLDPYHVWYQRGGLYVIGFDHRRAEIRTFAVDRILDLEATGADFQVREGFDFDAWTSANFGVVIEPASRVRVRFARERATQVRERSWHASQQIEERADGGVDLTMEVGGSSELTDWILSFGPGAEVLEPAALRVQVSQALESASALYHPENRGSGGEPEGVD
ncbi:MAG TPA: YafY family transcriptional regulator [Myxococcales bacterium]|nr:YafY family transcriptional regulator [Myxococcales bacterium]